MSDLKSNVTGTVLQVFVKVGDTIKPDQDLLSVESMKMEMTVPAVSGGVIKELLVNVDDFIQEGQVIIKLG